MDNIALRFLFDRKNEIKKGLLQIEVRLNNTSNRKFISTGIKLKKDQFTDKNGFTCRNHSNATALTAKAHRIYREVEAFILSDSCIGLEDVKNWNKEKATTHLVIEFINSELRRRNPSLAVIKYNQAFNKEGRRFWENKVVFRPYL